MSRYLFLVFFFFLLLLDSHIVTPSLSLAFCYHPFFYDIIRPSAFSAVNNETRKGEIETKGEQWDRPSDSRTRVCFFYNIISVSFLFLFSFLKNASRFLSCYLSNPYVSFLSSPARRQRVSIISHSHNFLVLFFVSFSLSLSYSRLAFYRAVASVALSLFLPRSFCSLSAIDAPSNALRSRSLSTIIIEYELRKFNNRWEVQR